MQHWCILCLPQACLFKGLVHDSDFYLVFFCYLFNLQQMIISSLTLWGIQFPLVKVETVIANNSAIKVHLVLMYPEPDYA